MNKSVFITSVFLFVSFSAFGTIDYDDTLPGWQKNELKEILNKALKDQKLPSIVVAATLDDKVIWARGVGHVDIANKKSPVVQKHLYRWASVSKVATERFAQGLEEQGVLDQSAPISTYIDQEEPSYYKRCFKNKKHHKKYLKCASKYGGSAPIEMIPGSRCFHPTSLKRVEVKKKGKTYQTYFEDKSKKSGKVYYRVKGGGIKCRAKYKISRAEPSSNVTLNNLLNHTSGVQHYEYLGKKSEPSTSAIKDVASIKSRKENGESQMAWAIPSFYPKHPLIFMPGKARSYSTFGYNLAGHVMEKASGKTFEQIMNEFKWRMGAKSMQADYYGIAPSGPYEKVNNYKRSDGKFIKNNYSSDNSYKLAGGGIMSTIVDAAKFCAAISQPGYVTRKGIDKYSHSGAHPKRSLSLLVLKTGGSGQRQCLVLMTNTNHDGVKLDSIRKQLETKLFEFGHWEEP